MVRLLVSAFELSVLDKESGCVWGAVHGTDRAMVTNTVQNNFNMKE